MMPQIRTFMELIIPEPSPMDEELDAELILIAAAGDDTERHQAASAFFRRYVRQLYRFFQQYQKALGGEDGVQDLVLMTFQRAFERAGTFNSDETLDHEKSGARTFRWLTKIGTNIMRDWIRSGGEKNPISLTRIRIPDANDENRSVRTTERGELRRYEMLSHEDAEKIPDPTSHREFLGGDSESPFTISTEAKCLQEALETLTDRERDVILISAQYSVNGKQLRLPPDVLSGLCKRFNTTKENIRAIRRRAYGKITRHVEANC